MFLSALILLVLGVPVAYLFGGVALLFASISPEVGIDIFNFLPYRIYGIMQNTTLLAVPLFILMGIILQKSRMAEDLLKTMSYMLRGVKGGLALSVILVGLILATTTGIVGASVVMMGVIALPVMMRYNYDSSLASGTVLASGTLGQIVPPSIILIILGDVMGVSVGDLFKSALVPSAILVSLYIAYILYSTKDSGDIVILDRDSGGSTADMIKAIFPPFILMFSVLGTIFIGVATPTESASIGVTGAIILTAINGSFSLKLLREAGEETLKITGMIFIILFGATAFSLVFNELGGTDYLVEAFTSSIESKTVFILVAMLIIFILGFFIDFIEIAFVVIPIILPISVAFGVDPLWFSILIAINLQTSFLTPPFGFALFFLKGAVKDSVKTIDMYRGVLPFIAIQLITLFIVALFPEILI
jgi:tripartite ATP-independent transporter DctM subunit